MMTARSSWFAIIRSNHLRRIAARCLAVVRFQLSNAREAASIARRVSATPIFGTVPMTSFEAGSRTSMVARPSASTQAPST